MRTPNKLLQLGRTATGLLLRAGIHKWVIRISSIIVIGIALSNVLLPAIARAQFAASARMSVADILAALVGQGISANSFTATASTGSGHICSSALESCVDLGPGSCNQIGTDGSGRIILGGTACSPEIWVSGGNPIFQVGNITTLNGAFNNNGTTMIRNNNSGVGVLLDDPDGVQVVSQAATPSCASGNKGTFSTLTSSGAAFYCNGTAAQQIVTKPSSWSASLDFAAFAGAGCQDLTISSTGAVKDEPVTLGGCGTVFSGDSDLACEASVTANDTSTVRLCCIDAAGCANLAAITFTVTALR